jgi:hypothetical protein
LVKETEDNDPERIEKLEAEVTILTTLVVALTWAMSPKLRDKLTAALEAQEKSFAEEAAGLPEGSQEEITSRQHFAAAKKLAALIKARR